MTFRTPHVLAAIVAASFTVIPASASAMPYSPPATTTSDAAQTGAGGEREATFPAAAYRGGDSPVDHPAASRAQATPTTYRGGDSPVDHPGASRAQPTLTTTTIEVVRPVRTIVRDVNQALPIALAGSALALVLAMFAVTLVRARPVPRPGRSH